MTNEIITVANVQGYLDTVNDTAWLNAEDVARGFGFTQEKNGVEYVRWETVNNYLNVFGFSQRVGKGDYIPENMVYRLGFKANNDTATRFQSVLADEVLPSIRKHGGYLTPQKMEEALLNPDVLIRLATDLKEERQKRIEAEQAKMIAEKVNQENAPKVLFADAVIGSRSTCLVGELAKILTQNGYKIGQNRLFKWLRENGYLGTKGEYYNIPNQRYIEMGLFDVKKTVHDENGVMVTKTTTKVTGRGQQYFINKFISA